MTDQQINDLISRHEVHEYHPGAILEFARELLAMASAPSLTVGDVPSDDLAQRLEDAASAALTAAYNAGKLAHKAGIYMPQIETGAALARVVIAVRDALALKPARQAEPVAFVHWPLNGPPRLVWYSNKAMHAAIEKGNKAQNGHVSDLLLYAAPQPAAQAEPAEDERGLALWQLIYGAIAHEPLPLKVAQIEAAAKRVEDMLRRRAAASHPPAQGQEG